MLSVYILCSCLIFILTHLNRACIYCTERACGTFCPPRTYRNFPDSDRLFVFCSNAECTGINCVQCKKLVSVDHSHQFGCARSQTHDSTVGEIAPPAFTTGWIPTSQDLDIILYHFQHADERQENVGDRALTLSTVAWTPTPPTVAAIPSSPIVAATTSPRQNGSIPTGQGLEDTLACFEGAFEEHQNIAQDIENPPMPPAPVLPPTGNHEETSTIHLPDLSHLSLEELMQELQNDPHYQTLDDLYSNEPLPTLTVSFQDTSLHNMPDSKSPVDSELHATIDPILERILNDMRIIEQQHDILDALYLRIMTLQDYEPEFYQALNEWMYDFLVAEDREHISFGELCDIYYFLCEREQELAQEAYLSLEAYAAAYFTPSTASDSYTEKDEDILFSALEEGSIEMRQEIVAEIRVEDEDGYTVKEDRPLTRGVNNEASASQNLNSALNQDPDNNIPIPPPLTNSEFEDRQRPGPELLSNIRIYRVEFAHQPPPLEPDLFLHEDQRPDTPNFIFYYPDHEEQEADDEWLAFENMPVMSDIDPFRTQFDEIEAQRGLLGAESLNELYEQTHPPPTTPSYNLAPVHLSSQYAVHRERWRQEDEVVRYDDDNEFTRDNDDDETESDRGDNNALAEEDDDIDEESELFINIIETFYIYTERTTSAFPTSESVLPQLSMFMRRHWRDLVEDAGPGFIIWTWDVFMRWRTVRELLGVEPETVGWGVEGFDGEEENDDSEWETDYGEDGIDEFAGVDDDGSEGYDSDGSDGDAGVEDVYKTTEDLGDDKEQYFDHEEEEDNGRGY